MPVNQLAFVLLHCGQGMASLTVFRFLSDVYRLALSAGSLFFDEKTEAHTLELAR